jgi:transposase-like protein
MPRERKHYSAEEKVAILRWHLLEKVSVSDLCDSYFSPSPSLAYHTRSAESRGTRRENTLCRNKTLSR